MVLTIRGLYQCVLHDKSLLRRWYWSLYLRFKDSNQRVLHDKFVSRCWYWSLNLTIRGLCWSLSFTSSAYPVLRCWYWPYYVTSMLNPCPNVYIDRKILHLGVCAQMSISIVNAFVTSRGLKLASCNLEFLIVPLNSRYVTMTSYVRVFFLLKLYDSFILKKCKMVSVFT